MEFNLSVSGAVSEQKLRLARYRTLRKLEAWASTHIARDLSDIADAKLKSLRSRLKTRVTQQGDKMSVWVGLNPIAAHRLGTARQTKRGVSVRSHRFKSAFMYKGIALRRISSANSDESEEFDIDRGNMEGYPRFPLAKVGKKIDHQGQQAIKRINAMLAQRFEEIFTRELAYVQQ